MEGEPLVQDRLGSGSHSVEVRVLGTKQAASSGTFVYVDAFKVGAVSCEETNAAVKTFFSTVSNASALGGSYRSDQPGLGWRYQHFADVQDGLQGHRRRRCAQQGDFGMAKVVVDGVLKATVDFYAAATTYAVKVYDSPTLTNGIHTVEVERPARRTPRRRARSFLSIRSGSSSPSRHE